MPPSEQSASLPSSQHQKAVRHFLYEQVQVIVSGVGDWRYVDCVSKQGGKLQALEYVRALFNIPRSHCVSAGDSGNDILMLKGAGLTR